MSQSKQLLLGNEAVARGLYEAGCRFVSSYPGTPSTEITEYASEYDLYAEWAPNEKVAVEAAVGASLAGARAFSGMKHVGLNVAADPLFTAAYTGVNGGLVITVADDPGMHSSQNEQDSRHYARAAKLPMLWPSDSAECLDYTKSAFDLSEQFDTPVLLGLSTRISHSRSAAALSEPAQVPLKPYVKDISKYVMAPASARGRHAAVEKRLDALRAWAEETPLNRIEWNSDRKIGVIAGGIAYQTAREALGDSVSYLKLGVVWPLPDELIKPFAASVETLYVIEELDDFIQSHCRALGLDVKGKELFSPLGEYTPAMIRAAVLGNPEESQTLHSPLSTLNAPLPVRPPVLCPGCPHTGLFYVLNKLKLTVMGDIGCYTLGANPPLNAMDFCLCMGASVSSLHGFVTARPEMASRAVATIGDSTFYHSGLTGLVDIIYNQSPCTVLILDNSITAMTGHQQNPGTGLTLQNKPAPIVDLETLCRGIGVRRVRVVDPHDLKELEQVLREELEAKEPSVVITRRPCALLPYVKKKAVYTVDSAACTSCRACMRIGCPAIRGQKAEDRGQKRVAMEIDPAQCCGCGLCVKLCKFGAISTEGGERS